MNAVLASVTRFLPCSGPNGLMGVSDDFSMNMIPALEIVLFSETKIIPGLGTSIWAGVSFNMLGQCAKAEIFETMLMRSCTSNKDVNAAS